MPQPANLRGVGLTTLRVETARTDGWPGYHLWVGGRDQIVLLQQARQFPACTDGARLGGRYSHSQVLPAEVPEGIEALRIST